MTAACGTITVCGSGHILSGLGWILATCGLGLGAIIWCALTGKLPR